MRLEEFTADKTGELVPIQTGRPDVSHAFVPASLPPTWPWPEDLWPLLLEASKRLASLDGTGKHLPNPDILLRPIELREAQLSSQLEGTITDPQKQALFQADPRYPTSVHDPTNAYREVFNYAKALQIGRDASLPLSKRLIQQLHSALMEGVRGYQATPGEFRTIQNQIGHPARFVPPPPQQLPRLLDDFEKYLHQDDGDPLVRAFLTHYQFEAIHPFRDGNGRVGRLLLALTIAEWSKLSRQWLYMSAFFERRKKEYMDLLFRVSTHGDWSSWIRFCLEGVIEQANDTEWRCEKLLALHREFHQRLKGGSVRLSAIVDRLFDSPIITILNVRDMFKITYPTAKSDVSKLEGLGILKPVPDQRTATYYCDPIYSVTYADIPPIISSDEDAPSDPNGSPT